MWPQISETVTLRRYAVQTLVDGRPAAQTPTTSTIRVSWQPGDDRTIPTGPGYSAPEVRRLYAFAEVLTADEHTGRPQDQIVTDDGAVWLVTESNPWAGLGPIAAHWECRVERVQPLTA